MTHKTTMEIKMYSTDINGANALEALMDYYNVSNLACISEADGLSFLDKIKEGEIRILDFLRA